jgi:CRISPR-associated helicase Cas3/CRISPR-associated endonuclease Cas3-HD
MSPDTATIATVSDKQPYFAHSANQVGAWHPLAMHLRCVGSGAEDMARGWPWSREALLAGLLHDLGKYGPLFQARLRGEESGLDHWSAGALEAVLTHKALGAALAIEGHHIGLQPALDLKNRLTQAHAGTSPLGPHVRLSTQSHGELLTRAAGDGLRFESCGSLCVELCGEQTWSAAIARMLDVRMLFSCLVDADFLDTEAHFNGTRKGKRHRPGGPILDARAALLRLEAHMQASVRTRHGANDDVAAVRAELWTAATSAAEHATGVFTLTAPTGSGKTLAMLQFALAHAVRNGLERVVLAVPYLSIIEQTARIYRSVFGQDTEHFILEHHSLAGLGAEQSQSDAEGSATEDAERQRRLLTENWDAPIVLTTNVQLLESLFSNRPAACRKLHRLRDAVVLFDEAQSLPQHLAVPTLAALSHLSAACHTSVVFATATQPAFDTLHDAVKKHASSGWQAKEVVPAHRGMFARLKRVQAHWPSRDERLDWPELAMRLSESASSLCIVNLKRHAHALLEALSSVEGVFHLSTNLCSAHRRTVLDAVRLRLQSNGAHLCRLVSTQCIEAGVDLDFPLVYRAMAPLDAIAQAAGRCNREGKLNAVGQLGQLHVFEPADGVERRRLFPTQAYFQAAEVTVSLLREAQDQLDINDPETFHRYYRKLYDLSGLTDRRSELDEAINALHFPNIARHYRLIEQDAIQVVVPWSQRIDDYEQLRQESMQGIDGHWIARAQALAVSVYRPKPGHPAWGVLPAAKLRRGGESDEWYVLEDRHRNDPAQRLYDDLLGLRLPDSQQIMIA